MFENFLTTLQPVNLMWIAIGSVVGAIIGALPGLTATMGVALFIPLTFSMPDMIMFGLNWEEAY